MLAENYKVDVNQQDFDGFTALHHCAIKNNKNSNKIAKYLCEQGANLEIKSEGKITALAIAFSNNNASLVQILEYQQKHGKWARHPFNTRKLIL